ncbi:subtilase family protein [Tahibacter aquaticus]|uniref:Subtilase family protein n=1 Tax=Tahibacter aquaticus TaxID=520092 RepID=A0A4R6ZAH5_9GAMM|nr:S8 family serine peptidase [Tahibacter aquaticus]TDR48832.1 subtilase family protein [Tahibacter aquaticus]
MKTITIHRTRLFLAASLALAGPAYAQVGVSPHFDADYALLKKDASSPGEQGMSLVHDYGAFALWRVDATHRARIAAGHWREVATLTDRSVALPAGAFTPGAADTQTAAAGTGVYLVQFVGPMTDAWLDRVRATGATPLQYINNNAYLVLADAAAGRALASLATRGEPLRYSAPLPASQKLTPEVARFAAQSPNGHTRLTVVVADHAGVSRSQNLIASLDTDPTKRAWSNLRGMLAREVDLPVARIGEIAALGDVLSVGLAVTERRLDEKQAQIIAGSLNPAQSGPSAPGYLTWLNGLGFSANPADYPVMSIVDDGVGDGTAVAGAGDANFTANGAGIDSRVTYAVSCTTASAAGIAGHGNINASIAAGYDDRSGFPFRDTDGFRRREGINPFGRVANVQIFGPGSSGACGIGQEGRIAVQQAQNVRISSNSWGLGNIFGPATGYIAESRAYDVGVRDADLTAQGNQQIAFIFAAGNYGPDPNTVASPGNAKNVLTVGASENQRPADEDGAWTDGCNSTPAEADNAMDVVGFSSRGPTAGGRTKPEVIAPGTHIQGSASVAAGYSGGGVCDKYRPSGQTAVAASSGTSHSAPAVAGAATLVYRYLQTAYAQAAPSPALIKSYLIAHPTYLTGVSANDTLPSFAQGFGMPNLAAAFASTPARVLIDQTETLADTGSSYDLRGAIADSTKPVRVVLSWTDAPGAVNSQAPQVNDLNLSVTVGGVTYVGNRFNGQWSSAAGGAADAANNTEVVYLPPGTSGSITVNVTGTNIAGDGVPGNADTTDQDFALVCNNCSQNPDFFLLSAQPVQQACGLQAASWPLEVGTVSGYTGTVALSATTTPAGTTPAFSVASGTAPFTSAFTLTPASPLAAGNYAIVLQGQDSTHANTGNLTLRYSPAAPAATTLTAPADDATNVAVLPTLSWGAVAGAVEYIVEIDDDANFGSIDRSATVTGTSYTPAALTGSTEYFWRVRARNWCGNGVDSATFSFKTLPLFCATPGVPIPDDNPDGVALTITLPPLGNLADLDLAFSTNHTWTGDLSLTLSKGATTATLMDRPGEPDSSPAGCSGRNANVVFDDEGADGSIEAGCANRDPAYTPAGGHFTPDQPLAAFDGSEAGGTWTVLITDAVGEDTGTVQSLCLLPTLQPPAPDAIFKNSFE